MSNEKVMKQDRVKVFEAVLSGPGMKEKCKVNLQLNRLQILLFCRLIELGLFSEKGILQDDVLLSFSKEEIDSYKLIRDELLQKGNLVEFYERLATL
jgi:hypothetical protein